MRNLFKNIYIILVAIVICIFFLLPKKYNQTDIDMMHVNFKVNLDGSINVGYLLDYEMGLNSEEIINVPQGIDISNVEIYKYRMRKNIWKSKNSRST